MDEVLMVKLLVLQAWYSLSDPELERQAADRISFRRFLGCPKSISDSTTVWLLRERLAETGRDRFLWAELQRQLDEKGYRSRRAWPRTRPSLPVTRGMPGLTSPAEMRPRHGGAGMVLGPRKAANPSSGTSCT